MRNPLPALRRNLPIIVGGSALALSLGRARRRRDRARGYGREGDLVTHVSGPVYAETPRALASRGGGARGVLS